MTEVDQMHLFEDQAEAQPPTLRHVLTVGETDLAYLGSDDKWVEFCGRYFGYPACCISWFIQYNQRRAAAYSEWRDNAGPRPEPGDSNALHPTRGHVMCPACRINPAPLPDRPADRWAPGAAPRVFSRRLP